MVLQLLHVDSGTYGLTGLTDMMMVSGASLEICIANRINTRVELNRSNTSISGVTSFITNKPHTTINLVMRKPCTPLYLTSKKPPNTSLFTYVRKNMFIVPIANIHILKFYGPQWEI